MSERQKKRDKKVTDTPIEVFKAAGEIMRRIHRNQGEISPQEREEILRNLTPKQRKLLESSEEHI